MKKFVSSSLSKGSSLRGSGGVVCPTFAASRFTLSAVEQLYRLNVEATQVGAVSGRVDSMIGSTSGNGPISVVRYSEA